MEDNKQFETINYKLFCIDRDYKTNTNLAKYIKEAQNFYNGDQYPNKNYKNMIRITMNMCSFSSNLKAAKIVGTQRYITYTSDNETDCTALQRFDEYNISKLNEKYEDFQSALNGLNNGTELVYYRWDGDDTSYKGIYKGGLVIEHIDPLQFAVANPYIQDIQNQKWVMFWKDEDISAVRDLVDCSSKEKADKVRKSIFPDEMVETNVDRQYVNHGLVTVFTRFFKIKGEVYYMVSTRTVDLFEYPHAISPIANKSIDKHMREIVDDYKKGVAEREGYETFDKVEDYKIDWEDCLNQLPNPTPLNQDEYKKMKEQFSLYPFAAFKPYAINGSFYGRSDIKELIPIQKGVNYALSMMVKCIENNAYNKIFVKEGALNGQVLTNEPSQVIVDHSRNMNGWGIKMAESQPMPNGVIDFVDRFVGMSRVFYGFNDVMDGSISNQDISGYAVQQMIKQANSSIEQQQQLFWKFCKDKAAIRLMFYKFFVDKAKYTYELEDFTVDNLEQKRQILNKRNEQLQARGGQLEILQQNPELAEELKKPVMKTQVREFAGKDIWGTNFDIGIDVMQGLADSKLAESQMWDTLIMNGGIQNMEPEMLEMYLQANPTVSKRTKDALKNIVEKQKQSENYQLKQQLQQVLAKAQQLAEYTQQLEAQMGYTKDYLKNLTSEFTNKINVANKTIQAQNQMIANTESEGEKKSNNARGISQSQAQTSTVE